MCGGKCVWEMRAEVIGVFTRSASFKTSRRELLYGGGYRDRLLSVVWTMIRWYQEGDQ